MNTLQSHNKEFENGLVTESGFRALKDAETYDAAASIGAGSTCLSEIWTAFYQGKPLSLFSDSMTNLQPKSEEELSEWCKHHFPACYQEYLECKRN